MVSLLSTLDTDADEDLAVAWAAIRAKPLCSTGLAQAYTPPPIEPLALWLQSLSVEGPRPSLSVIPGPTHQDRLQVYRHLRNTPGVEEHELDLEAQNWANSTVATHLTRSIAAVKVHPEVVEALPVWFPASWEWGILWALAGVSDFRADGYLRSRVDRSQNIEHQAYKALWELRFLLKENSSFDPGAEFFFTFVRWLTGANLSNADRQALDRIGVTRRVASSLERFDLLCFLIMLAAQNGILDRVVVCFDGLEQAFHRKPLLLDLDLFLACVERWVSTTDVPLGVLLGCNAHDLPKLRLLCPSLAHRVEAGLAWTL